MSNLIDRQKALDALTEIIMNFKNVYGDMGSAVNGARECIKSLPSAEPNRKTGKWIFHIDDLFPEESTQECSVCHEEEFVKIQNDNFCPNCGADMRDKENG